MYLNQASYAFHEFMKTIRALRLTKFKEYGLAGVKLCNTYILMGKGRIKNARPASQNKGY